MRSEHNKQELFALSATCEQLQLDNREGIRFGLQCTRGQRMLPRRIYWPKQGKLLGKRKDESSCYARDRIGKVQMPRQRHLSCLMRQTSDSHQAPPACRPCAEKWPTQPLRMQFDPMVEEVHAICYAPLLRRRNIRQRAEIEPSVVIIDQGRAQRVEVKSCHTLRISPHVKHLYAGVKGLHDRVTLRYPRRNMR